MKNDTWTEEEIVQQAVGQIPWGHNTVLLDKLDTKEQRLAYARLAAKNGWSRNVMVHYIELKTAERIGEALPNARQLEEALKD